VAVTGHRKLPDPAATARDAEKALDLILASLPPAAMPGLRIIVLTALAEGADRIVADRVLARPRSRIEAILPLPETEYCADFTATSRADFARLLGLADTVTEMPPAASREDAYDAAGRYLTDRADVIIAVWNGRRGAGKGGTADVVRYARQARRPMIWIPTDGRDLVAENLEGLASYGSG